MKGILQKGKDLKKDLLIKAGVGGGGGGENKKKEEGVVFGGSIDRTSNEIPVVMMKCVEYLDNTGLHFEGIFRKSGSLAQLNELKAKFERGEDVDLSGIMDPHVVAGLLKMYVRELKEPLLTFELYDMFLAAVAIKDVTAKIAKIRQVLAFLPCGHLVVIRYLVSFLVRVCAKSNENMMTPSNLAIVFAPNLLRPPYTGDQELAVIMEDTPYSNELLQIFITHSEKIFKNLETQVSSETMVVKENKQGFLKSEPRPTPNSTSLSNSPSRSSVVKPLPPLPSGPPALSPTSHYLDPNKPPSRPPPVAPDSPSTPNYPSRLPSSSVSAKIPPPPRGNHISPDLATESSPYPPLPNPSRPAAKARPTAIRKLPDQLASPSALSNTTALAARSDTTRPARFAVSYGTVPPD